MSYRVLNGEFRTVAECEQCLEIVPLSHVTERWEERHKRCVADPNTESWAPHD